MYNSKLYTILQHFDKYEQNRCRKYVQSPYFNRSEELIFLFEIFIKDINRAKPRSIGREEIWKKLQPKKKYDDVRFRKYCSDLLKLVEGFLAQEFYNNNELEKSAYLMQALIKKKIPELAPTAIRNAHRLINNLKYRDANFYYSNYKIENYYYYLTEFETKRSERSNIEEISENLDIFFLAEKLRIFCADITQRTLAEHEYKLFFTDKILDHLSKFDYEKYPPVALYYQIYLTLTQTDHEEHYFKLKYLLDEYGLIFPPDEAKDVLYMAAQNYCIRKINKGNSRFMGELFSLYEDLLAKEIIIADGELSPWYFKNIVVVALRLGKYEWTENFIHTYSKMLPDAFRENALTYNLAQVYFYQKKHEKVIELLREVEYEDVAYNLNSKSLLIATYYETDEFEPLYSLFESFRTYLNRHKDIPDSRRQLYKNLIKYTKKLAGIAPGDGKAIKKLKEEIEINKNIASANWLKEKIAELEG